MLIPRMVVPVPNLPGKIVFKRQKDNTYVLLLVGLERCNTQKRTPKPVRKAIGRLIDNDDRTLMQPNDYYAEHFGLDEATFDSRLSSSIKVGSHVVMKHIAAREGISDMLKRVFGEKIACRILDASAFFINKENSAMSRFDEYSREFPLFGPAQMPYNSSFFSRMFEDIELSQVDEFLRMWNESHASEADSEVVISIDHSNKNSKAGDLEILEFGHAKKNIGAPIVGIALAMDSKNKVPLDFMLYQGSIPDVSQVQDLIARLRSYGYKKITVVMDRGFYSENNIIQLDEAGFDFVLMAKGSKRFVRDLVINKSEVNYHPEYRIKSSESPLYGATFKHELFGKERWVHVFKSPAKVSSEICSIEDRIKSQKQAFDKALNTVKEFPPEYEEYFDLNYSSKGVFLGAKEKEDVVADGFLLAGHFCIITSRKMTADQAYAFYKGRDSNEKIFSSSKTFLGGEQVRVHSDKRLVGKEFVMFIALIIRCAIYSALGKTRLSSSRGRKPVCVPKAIALLNMITIDCILHKGRYSCLRKLSKSQALILSCFGLDEEAMREECRLIGDKYLIAQQDKETSLDRILKNEPQLPQQDEIDDLAGVTGIEIVE